MPLPPRRRSLARTFRLCLGAFALAGALAGCASEPPDASAPAPAAPASAEVGEPAPDFTLTGLDGETFSLSAQRGEVVVLNFWATWCLPCLAEMPELEALHQELGNDGVRIVGISQDAGGTDEIRQMAERLGITYPVLPDPAFQVATRYGGIPVLPTTIFVGPDGRIAIREAGAMSKTEIKALIEQARDTHS